MSRRIGNLQADPLDAKPVAIGDAHGHHVDAGLLAHHRDALRAVPQRAKAGDVIGVQVRIDRLHQLQIEFAHQLQIAIDLLQHRIDDQRLAAAAGCQQVGVGAGCRIEELAEDHDRPLNCPLGAISTRNAGRLAIMFLSRHGRQQIGPRSGSGTPHVAAIAVALECRQQRIEEREEHLHAIAHQERDRERRQRGSLTEIVE